ncbi:MAG: Uma2 family endonuclease [Bariatricus sp.]
MIYDILKRKKEEKGMTTEALSRLSGVSVGTINKILNGETRSPGYDTLAALERVLLDKKDTEEFLAIRDSRAALEYKECGPYTIKDYRALPKEVRAELIDGELIIMEAPQIDHQILVMKIAFLLELFIRKNKGKCVVLPSPLDVQLDCDDKTIVQPDIVVICNRERLVKRGVYGAPDMVIEITPTSSRKMDYLKKMDKYLNAGVREYWVVDLQKRKVVTYNFAGDPMPCLYTFDDKVPVWIFEDKLEIDFAELTFELKEIAGM